MEIQNEAAESWVSRYAGKEEKLLAVYYLVINTAAISTLVQCEWSKQVSHTIKSLTVSSD